MSATGVAPGAGAAPGRVLLSPAALEHVGGLARVAMPWQRTHPAQPYRPRHRRVLVEPGGPVVQATTELADLGLLLAPGRVHPALLAAVGVLAAPTACVDLDVVAPGPGGGSPRRLRSWQRWSGGQVSALSTAGGAIELSWFDDSRWQAELTRVVVAVSGPPPDPDRVTPGPPIRDKVVTLPHEVLLAAGPAVRQGRVDLLVEMVARHPGRVDLERLRALHTEVQGRLRVVVSGWAPGPRDQPGAPTTRLGRKRIGWVSWLRYADGWWALTPYLEDGPGRRTPWVRVHPVEPAHLGVEVARLVGRMTA